MITVHRGDGWQRHLRLEAGRLLALPVIDITQPAAAAPVLQVPGHGLPARWRVAIQGLDWPGVVSRHRLPGPDDWHTVTVLDADHLQLSLPYLTSVPAIQPGACIQLRRPLDLTDLTLSVSFTRPGGRLLAQPAGLHIQPGDGGLLLRADPAMTQGWPLGELQCRLQLQWPDGSQRTHVLHRFYVEN